jgi:hypothetical protein
MDEREMARKFLAAPTSSASAERLFLVQERCMMI